MSPLSLRTVAALVVFLGALAGCAHTAPAPDQAAPRSALVTGSRIPRAVDPVTGRVTTESPVRVYSAQELNATGDPSLGGALRRIDPSFH